MQPVPDFVQAGSSVCAVHFGIPTAEENDLAAENLRPVMECDTEGPVMEVLRVGICGMERRESPSIVA